MTKHASYIFSSYSSLLNLSLDQLLQVGNNLVENSSPIPSFDEDLLVDLCSDAEKIFEIEDTILKIDGDVIIVGDIHGSFHDLLRIIHYIQSNPCQAIFLGDYVDRGEFSLECITLLFTLKILYPEQYYLLRGNHEFDVLCSQYGFKKEILNHHNPKRTYHLPDPKNQIQKQADVKRIDYDKHKKISPEKLCDNYFANHVNINNYKYTEKLYRSFIRAFSYLPIAALVNSTSLCIHGGLSPLLDRIDKINIHIQRPINDYESNPLLADILWGDPAGDQVQSFEANPRGCGQIFSGVMVVQFLKGNNLNRIIRGHECVNSGIQLNFNEKCITVFSASSYNHDMGNKSGILRLFQKDDKFQPIKFTPLHRLKKCDANYYRVQRFAESSKPISLYARLNLRKFSSFDGIIEEDIASQEAENNRKSKPNMINLQGFFMGRRISFNTGFHKKLLPHGGPALPKAMSPSLNNLLSLNPIAENGEENENISKLPSLEPV